MRTTIIAICSIIFLLNFSFAQTTNNTFPSNGYVGIGLTTPVAPLEVVGTTGTFGGQGRLTAAFEQDAQQRRGVYLGFDGSGQIGIIASGTNGTASSLAFYNYNNSAWQESMRLASNGYLGLGNTTPLVPLDVSGRTAYNLVGTIMTTAGFTKDHTTNKGIGIGFDDANASQTGIIYSGSAGSSSNIAFWNYSGNAWFEAMRITGTGKVGIGTASPTNNLQIGTQTAASTATPITLSLGSSYSNTAGKNPKLKLYDDGSTFFGFGISPSTLDAMVPAGNNFAWYVNGIQKMILNSTGNVGIGTMTPLSGLDVKGSLAIGSYAGTNAAPANGLIISGNVGMGTNTPLSGLDVKGSLAIGSYAGTNAAPANGLIVSGNLGIGTTSPTNNLQIGSQTAGTTATPNTLSLGSSYSNAAGKNPKLKLYDDGTNFFGFGISPSTLDAMVPAGNNFAWYVNGSQKMILNSTGNLGVGTSSPTVPLHVLSGTASNIPFLYETGLVEKSSDNKFGVFCSTINPILNGTTPAGAGYSMAFTNYLNANQNHPGFDIQEVVYGTATSQNVLRFVADERTSSGVITNPVFAMSIAGNGNVGIGYSDASLSNSLYKLSVNGSIHIRKADIEVNNWNDYVFDANYKLPALTDIKAYIDQNHHLPEIPSEQEMIKNGLDVGEMNKILVKKVEELTLYMIEKDNKLKDQDSQLKVQNSQLKDQDNKLKDQDNKVKEQDSQLKEQYSQLKDQEARLKKLEEIVEKLKKDK